MGDISFETFTRDIHRYFDRDAQFQQRLSELPPGVYLFGHCHIQWHYASDDGRVVLLNVLSVLLEHRARCTPRSLDRGRRCF